MPQSLRLSCSWTIEPPTMRSSAERPCPLHSRLRSWCRLECKVNDMLKLVAVALFSILPLGFVGGCNAGC
jgi:hypothetical protein